ncbi:MAG: DNA cytosine methyltransferase [Elusimicrobiota bacterium]|jgi:DNA (cytosine-5)-methyltransferase 1|nr:DNA cytosine methyltransferase [Elusimicrobiota bacterium]
MDRKLKLIDLFAGVGGLSYGFAKNNKFEIIAANEILPNMAKAYSLNHNNVKVYVKDIKDFNSLEVEKDTGIKSSDIDIVIGGPPCQAYSTVGKRLIDDPRGKLFSQYYRIVKEFNPYIFLFENVKGILSMQNGMLLKNIIDLFETLGYEVSHKVVNAADFGAPQIRERVIIIGSKLSKSFHYPQPTHSSNDSEDSLFKNNLKSYLTIEDAISDLPFINTNEESFSYSSQPKNDFQRLMRKNAPEKLMDHNAPKNNDKLVKMMKLLPDGGTPNDLPKDLRPSSGFKNTYCRLWWNRPATTITRNLSTPSSSRCIHPKAPRPLTTREGARIQCFPDDFKFYGSKADRNLQVGNAVPTFLSTVLANSILENFKSAKMI